METRYNIGAVVHERHYCWVEIDVDIDYLFLLPLCVLDCTLEEYESIDRIFYTRFELHSADNYDN